MAVGGCSYPGPPVLSSYLNHDKRFGFIELRTVEEAAGALALDGTAMLVRDTGHLWGYQPLRTPPACVMLDCLEHSLRLQYHSPSNTPH